MEKQLKNYYMIIIVRELEIFIDWRLGNSFIKWVRTEQCFEEWMRI